MGEVIDTTIFREQRCYGIGICIRGSLWKFIKAKTTLFFVLPQPHKAEARGLKEAIKLLDSMGLSKVSIELDCKQVVDNITRRLNINSMFGAIIEICKTSLKIYHNFKISFIRRQTNSIAHLLTWMSLSYVSSHFHNYMSSCIVIVIINEMS